MLIRADARRLPLVDGCVQTCVTSPPYFGLRDYGSAKWVGGDAACDHRQGRPGAGRADGIVDERAQRNRDGVGSMGGDCKQCGAQRIDPQIGLEASPDAYVQALLTVFAEVWRVLKDDGTVWLNLGDSFANDAKWGGSSGGKHVTALHGASGIGRGKKETGLKSKDLIGIPWRVAFALQAAGWYLRSDIIWSKPNPMPESVTDRPTKAHEYIFLLSKQERYYYDAEAIAEKSHSFGRQHTSGTQPPKVQALKASGHHGAGGDLSINYERLERNKRSVWHVATQPYSGAHFATFPPALITPCILAGSRMGDLVLDPFIGSGTVGDVCTTLMRRWVGVDLSYQYLAMKRTEQLGFANMFTGGNDG